MRRTGFILVGMCVLIAGCPFLPSEPPPEAVLEGDWTTTSEEGTIAVVRFNDNGVVVNIFAATEEGVTVSVNVTGASTTLDGSDVTVRIPTATGEAVFEGTLTEDQNTMTGSLDRVITIGDDVVITVPQGDVTLVRVETVECVSDADCDTGESCINFLCVADDPCEGVTCDPGQVCEEGVCVPEDACADVTCMTCETCVEGVCEPLVGDQVVGAVFYTDNGCALCHGDNAEGVIGPSLVGAACSDLFDVLSGNVAHTGGTVSDVTEQDAADLEAWLGSL